MQTIFYVSADHYKQCKEFVKNGKIPQIPFIPFVEKYTDFFKSNKKTTLKNQKEALNFIENNDVKIYGIFGKNSKQFNDLYKVVEMFFKEYPNGIIIIE